MNFSRILVSTACLEFYCHDMDMTWNGHGHDMAWHDMPCMSWHAWHDMTSHAITWHDMDMTCHHMTWHGHDMTWTWHDMHDMTWHRMPSPPPRPENPSLISHPSDQMGEKCNLGSFFQPELPHLGMIRGVISLNSLILAWSEAWSVRDPRVILRWSDVFLGDPGKWNVQKHGEKAWSQLGNLYLL